MVTYRAKDFEPYVSMGGAEVDVNAIPDRSITVEQYKTVRANSDGFTALHRKLDNECLRYVTAHCLNNCRVESYTTYDYSLKNYIIPELLKRLEEY